MMLTESHPCRSLIMNCPTYNCTAWQFLNLEAKVDEEGDEGDKDKEDKMTECMFLLNLQLFYFLTESSY